MVRFSKRRDSAGPIIFGPGPRARLRRRHPPRLLGDLEDPVRISVRELQEALVRAGYDVGSTGVDGRWGPNTRAAYRRFLRSIGRSDESQELDPTTQMLSIEGGLWSQLTSAAPGTGGERQSDRSSGRGGRTRSRSSTDPGSAADQLDAEEDGMSMWQVVLLGGGVLLATGAIAYALTSGPSDDEPELREAELLPQF